MTLNNNDDNNNIIPLCVHMKICIFRRVVCNTCGVMCSNFTNQSSMFDPNCTYCSSCTNVFCYNCLPVRLKKEKIPIEETTEQQRINVQCHLCVACPVAIETISKVCNIYLYIFIYFLI